LIKADVALFSSVISSANSAYYGFSQKITSIERALSLLGLSRIFTIVQLAALKNSLSAVGPMERFWDSAAEVATISALLAQRFTTLSSDEAYTLGMLHDCGIPLMMRAHPEYRDFLRTLNSSSLTEINACEVEQYGTSHYQLGAELARKWDFPETIASAIARQPSYHDTFAEPNDENEAMRINLCLLLLARDISDIYRHFWRITDRTTPFIDLTPALTFLGISDFEYADTKEDLLALLGQQQ